MLQNIWHENGPVWGFSIERNQCDQKLGLGGLDRAKLPRCWQSPAGQVETQGPRASTGNERILKEIVAL